MHHPRVVVPWGQPEAATQGRAAPTHSRIVLCHRCARTAGHADTAYHDGPVKPLKT